MTITLTDEEFQLLLVALGVALGTFRQKKDEPMMRGILHLANAVNRDNPQWTPCEVPEAATG